MNKRNLLHYGDHAQKLTCSRIIAIGHCACHTSVYMTPLLHTASAHDAGYLLGANCWMGKVRPSGHLPRFISIRVIAESHGTGSSDHELGSLITC